MAASEADRLAVGEVEGGVVAQRREDLGQVGGAEDLVAEFAVLVGEPLDLLEADLVDLPGVHRQGREPVDGAGIDDVAVVEPADSRLVLGPCCRQHILEDEVALPGERRAYVIANRHGEPVLERRGRGFVVGGGDARVEQRVVFERRVEVGAELRSGFRGMPIDGASASDHTFA
jgi:hypothetical protein